MTTLYYVETEGEDIIYAQTDYGWKSFESGISYNEYLTECECPQEVRRYVQKYLLESYYHCADFTPLEFYGVTTMWEDLGVEDDDYEFYGEHYTVRAMIIVE